MLPKGDVIKSLSIYEVTLLHILQFMPSKIPRKKHKTILNYSSIVSHIIVPYFFEENHCALLIQCFVVCLSQDPIPTSLLKISSDLVSHSIKLFHVILKYMGIDSPAIISMAERIDLVAKLYKHTLKRSELRDELFAQISKQTRNNPDR
jgi:hypothetical protein